jgi:hypothetical protein
LRTEAGLARIASRGHRSGSASCENARTTDPWRELAGHAWERDAQYECASVPAFLDLAESLLACDAPLELVEQALNAACDEIAHAQICAVLASRYLGETISPTMPSAPRRAPVGGQSGLIRLALESWIDGCLGEGAAAWQAARTRKLATDPVARDALDRIAADETRHAELGWQVLHWAVKSGGADACDAVRSLRDVEPAPAKPAEFSDGIESLGRLSSDEMNAVTEVNLIASRRRLDRCLSALTRVG